MLTLALLRHAKSSWEAAGVTDFERPLNARGRQAAPVMGDVLAEIGLKPDIILCSAANRTRETLALAATRFSLGDTPVVYEEALYLAEPDELLARLHRLPAEVTCVLLIGHNPGFEELAQMLVRTGDAKSIVKLEEKFPTGALAVFTFTETSFADIGAETGRLEHFITPRERA